MNSFATMLYYVKNDFVPLIKEEKPDRNTVPMYMDLKEFY